MSRLPALAAQHHVVAPRPDVASVRRDLEQVLRFDLGRGRILGEGGVDAAITMRTIVTNQMRFFMISPVERIRIEPTTGRRNPVSFSGVRPYRSPIRCIPERTDPNERTESGRARGGGNAIVPSPPPCLWLASTTRIGGRKRSPPLRLGSGGGPRLARDERRRDPQRRHRHADFGRRAHRPRSFVFAYRIYLSYDFNEKHGLRLLFAPLTIEGDGTPSEEIRFDGETFPADVVTHASYTFNSYRLTYRYRFHDGENWRWHVGFTAKIRDAEVIVSQASNEASYDNLGFVPLLHLAGEWKMTDRWSAILDADALAAPQGRAEDVALKIGYRFGGGWSARRVTGWSRAERTTTRSIPSRGSTTRWRRCGTISRRGPGRGRKTESVSVAAEPDGRTMEEKDGHR